jgi:hypothetical protein
VLSREGERFQWKGFIHEPRQGGSKATVIIIIIIIDLGAGIIRLS